MAVPDIVKVYEYYSYNSYQGKTYEVCDCWHREIQSTQHSSFVIILVIQNYNLNTAQQYILAEKYYVDM